MHIKVEFVGFPMIYDLFPQGSHAYTFPGGTLNHLVEDLLARNDSRIKEALLEPGTNSFDPTIQVMINGQLIPRGEIGGKKIEEGDRVTFLRLLAGG